MDEGTINRALQEYQELAGTVAPANEFQSFQIILFVSLFHNSFNVQSSNDYFARNKWKKRTQLTVVGDPGEITVGILKVAAQELTILTTCNTGTRIIRVKRFQMNDQSESLTNVRNQIILVSDFLQGRPNSDAESASDFAEDDSPPPPPPPPQGIPEP